MDQKDNDKTPGGGLGTRERIAEGLGKAIRLIRHDFRTSLNQIIGYSEMLEEELTALRRDDLGADAKKIRSAAGKMLGLVNSTFDFDTLRAGDPSAGGPDGSASGGKRRGSGPDAGRDPAVGGTEGEILVVDDDASDRDMMSGRLATKGHRVSVAADGLEALEKIRSGTFDLVILDIVMPGLGGLEVLREIRNTRLPAELPVIMATSRDSSEDIVRAFELGASDYVTKPFDFPVVLARVATQLGLKRVLMDVEKLAGQLEMRNAFLRKLFGRYLADEIVDDILADPAKLSLSGEKRRVTVLFADLRGFSSLTERLAPESVIDLLNLFLSRMTDVIVSHGGTIDEFVGDSILAVFGAPVGRPDDAERAVACAVAMQSAMDGVNRALREKRLPDVSMGIGIHTGPAIVGNVGSEKRMKYAVVGPTVVVASRIESCTVGGQILVSAETRDEVGSLARVNATLRISPKGSSRSLTLYDIGGIEGRYAVHLAATPQVFRPLAGSVGFQYCLVEEKMCRDEVESGAFLAVSANGATVRLEKAVPEMAEIRITAMSQGRDPSSGTIYAKVLFEDEKGTFRIRFTSMDPAGQAFLGTLA